MWRLTFLCIACFFYFQANSQTDPLTQAHGARSQGMGNLKVNLPDAWTVFNNIGALDRISASEIAVGYDQRFGLNELSTLDLAASLKTEKGSFGLGLSRFGGKLFNQQMFGIGYSQKLGISSFGVKADWFQTQIQDFGTGNSFVFSLGGVADLGPKIQIGGYFSNINRAKISNNSQDHLPTAINLGLTYVPISTLKIHLETEKDILIKPVVKAGLEYGIHDLVLLRAGVNSNPSRLFFGLGIRPGKFLLDYGMGQNTALGSTHHVSLGFQWD
ncbi:PorV/PorQ family protein [Algoriphagus pacificus]|uniref:Type IX secretion system membrane protein, PorP/SprF family n=1 Tax=Algoriphagus pacificus TaxID=2811234 RepID=A0ABS3CJF8_9BACT|nr:hypothetical protein [Algoriphagus pacificus]MBN7815784.1 hypothetical protein [Algoriphagus pacificus]